MGLLKLTIVFVVIIRKIEGVQGVFVPIGDSVRLNCSNGFNWFGPNNSADENGTMAYFDKSAKNPYMQRSNVALEMNDNKAQYDLIINGVYSENVGLYVCHYRTDSNYSSKRYWVGVNHIKMTSVSVTIQESSTVRRKNSKTIQQHSPLLPIILCLLVMIVIGILVAFRKEFPCRSSMFRLSCSTARKDVLREEDEIDFQGSAVDNAIHQSNNDIHGHANGLAEQMQDNGSVHESHLYQPNGQARACNNPIQRSGDQLQITEGNLLYVEIGHQETPPGGFRVIHGLNNRTIYAEVNHLLTVQPITEGRTTQQ